MTNAPIPNKYGRMSEFWTAISFLTGLKIYQEHRTKKKKNPAMAHSHSNSLLLSPGEKGELVWKFSNKVKLEAACNVPGHYEVGMISKINEI